MTTELNPKSAQIILAWLAKISKITEVEQLLNVVVDELPGIVGAKGCWVYLLPSLVPEYHNSLVDGNGNDIEEGDLENDFIVLAATNRESKKNLVGKAYFSDGEGVAGWVFRQQQTLRLDDVTNQLEIAKWSGLYWNDKYNDGAEFYSSSDEKRPILVIPLIDISPIGILKFHASINKEPFSAVDEQIAIVVAQIISAVIRSTSTINEQEQIILKLIEISNKKDMDELASAVTAGLKRILKCSETQLYLRRADGKKIKLIAKNGSIVKATDAIEYARGQCLVGWVFKNRMALSIQDIRHYMNGKELSDEELATITGTETYDDDDKYIKYEGLIKIDPVTSRLKGPISFLAVPVISKDGELEGVLCAYSNNSKNSPPLIGKRQQQLLSSFASTTALSLENHLKKELGALLISLGIITDAEKLFSYVTEKIPSLVMSSGCSIFKMAIKPGEQHYRLELVSTSRPGLKKSDGKPYDIVYSIGEGKTGFCADTHSTIMFNHFGSNKRAVQSQKDEIERIQTTDPDDLVETLKDNSGNIVGFMQARKGKKLRMDYRANLRLLAKSSIFDTFGLPSKKLEPYINSIEKSWSYIAVPIKKSDQLYGVITVARPAPNTPFSTDDVELLESIAGRLASAMESIKIEQERQRMLINIAHEINTPLIGISADSLIIRDELPQDSELYFVAKRNANIVSGLKMQTKTLMRVLSEKKYQVKFSEHSIFRPLKTACEVSESEAFHKGCEIKGPTTYDKESFPKIEMVLDELTIAFNNLIQNAVKYSFRPPAGNEKNRYVFVAGRWSKDSNYYMVYIQNYGVSITKEEIENRLIYRPFYRGEKATDRYRTGSGVGLTYARDVIEDMHHGSITVSSEHQGGDAYLTTFIVRLPVKQPKN
ncbi:MAG: GAF domain-containing sensor histidine kinase [Chloroflexi bacterium]|nr:GAF domain-containing sensor histidine kinase [Chloroflexota bacterium]